MKANTTTTSTPGDSGEPVTPRSSTTMDSNEVGAYQCAICTQPAAHRCSGCVGGRDTSGKERQISYCSKECQRKHWIDGHKLECKGAMERRQLYKIGAIMQWVFYSNREYVWHDEIEQVHHGDKCETDEGGHLVVQLDASDEGSFTKFPAELFSKESEKRAVLVACAGKTAVASMAALLAMLIKGSGFPTSISSTLYD
jgi:hypothetical protein